MALTWWVDHVVVHLVRRLRELLRARKSRPWRCVTARVLCAESEENSIYASVHLLYSYDARGEEQVDSYDLAFLLRSSANIFVESCTQQRFLRVRYNPQTPSSRDDLARMFHHDRSEAR